MKLFHSVWIVFTLVACSRDSEKEVAQGPVREVTNISCPVHNVPVFKVEASSAIHCSTWDPKLGLTIDQLKQRFPYAVWDSNIHLIDESPDAPIHSYYMVCDRCTASWREYATANRPLFRNNKFVVSVTGTGEITISETEFSLEQLTAISKTISASNSEVRVHIRAEKTVPVEFIKSVANACGEGGFTHLVFGALEKDMHGVSKPEVKAINAE